MDRVTLYKDDYVHLFSLPDGVYIETFKKGFPIAKINTMLSEHPEVEVSNFMSLKNALSNAPVPPEKIGRIKERLLIEFSDKDLKAFLTLNLPKIQLDPSNRSNLIAEIKTKLAEKNVVFGVKEDVLKGELVDGHAYIIAEGLPPVDGEDAVVKMYSLQDARPEVDERGNVDYYDLKLINRVVQGDWLGERKEATEGIAGKSVKGLTLLPNKGKTLMLNYDKNTVQEVNDHGLTVLYARVSGAVNYQDNKITVSNHMEIDGNVDFRTGNIKFDGHVTIKGTVADGFSVEATGDIEINSSIGLGNVKSIISTGGSIFLKGGIASKGQAFLKAARNIFTKFIDNVTVECEGTLHIGFYAINSVARATEVIIDSSNGKIIGGHTTASIRVLVPVIGSEMEKKTVVEVKGFDRERYKQESEKLVKRSIEIKQEQQKLKQQVSRLEATESMTPFQRKEMNECIDQVIHLKKAQRDAEERRKEITGYLKAKGDGEITVSKRIHPNSTLMVRGQVIEIASPSSACTYYVQEGILKQV